MLETKDKATGTHPADTEEPTTDGAFSDDGVDLTVIRWMLDLTPAERLQAVQDLIDAASALGAGAGDDSPRFLELLRALDRHGVEHVIVGGVAAILEGAPMTTLDLDVVFRVDDDNIARLNAVLTELDARYRDPAGRSIAPTPDRLRTHRVNLLETSLGLLDVMHVVGAGWRYEDVLARSHTREIEDLRVRVLDLADVIASKEAAGRDKDRAMLPLLRRTLELKRS